MKSIVFIILQIFFATWVILKIGEYRSDIPEFSLGHIQSRDVFRPIARQRKYLMVIMLNVSANFIESLEFFRLEISEI